MPEEPVLEVEVVEPGTELEPVAPTTLFRTDDPVEVLSRATAVAEALAPVIKEQGLFANIKGKQHITVEGWQTLGAMLGVTPVCTWTKKLEDGWEARVESRTLDGRVIGAAEAECLRAEGTWKDRDDFALRSMAQTRATSKALASVLRFVVTLSGFEGTPAEEMPRDGGQQARGASDKQLDYVASLIARNFKADAYDESLIRSFCAETMNGSAVSNAIEKLKAKDEKYAFDLAERAQVWQQKQSDVPADSEGLEQGKLDESGMPWEPARG